MLCILVSVGLVFAGTTGKIAGSVLDQDSGEPLAGANVVLVGTGLGAAVDVDGDFFTSICHLAFIPWKFP
jgi:hypothetical protein